MIRIFLILVCLCFSLPGCSAQNKKEIRKQPEISDPYSWDFGKRQEGEVLKHTFVLKNKSKTTLTIKDMNTSCGCAISKVEKKVLSAGESTLVEVQFNTKGYSGPVEQYIYAHTDSLDSPIIRFIIKAEVVKKSLQSTVDSP